MHACNTLSPSVSLSCLYLCDLNGAGLCNRDAAVHGIQEQQTDSSSAQAVIMIDGHVYIRTPAMETTVTQVMVKALQAAFI